VFHNRLLCIGGLHNPSCCSSKEHTTLCRPGPAETLGDFSSRPAIFAHQAAYVSR
jgi:hypothetical protein